MTFIFFVAYLMAQVDVNRHGAVVDLGTESPLAVTYFQFGADRAYKALNVSKEIR